VVTEDFIHPYWFTVYARI